jgi:flavin-dependent dehydrogenase
MKTDVLVVGGGPAGAVAATVLARAGARVLIVDRATFPREKLCGDTVNPGTLALLRRLKLADCIDRCGLPIDGMLVTGEGGVRIDGTYPQALQGRALVRSQLDWALLHEAIKAGAQFEPGIAVRSAITASERRGEVVDGVSAGSQGTSRSIHARVTIAADGRRSAVAFGLGLARHPSRPRRWAIGAHYTDVAGLSSRGEMHVRAGRYIGVAPLPNGVTNVCLVKPAWGPGRTWGPALAGPTDGSLEAGPHVRMRDPEALLRQEIERDDQLRDRFAGARLVRAPIVLGPLAVDSVRRPPDGLILAGDAAGFVDPMTGDGLRFAVRGGELAGLAALEALEHGWSGVHARLADHRRRDFAGKQRFNRALRSLVSSPRAIALAARGARLAPWDDPANRRTSWRL